ncbi:hypothetical protein [Oricola sp.]|uniref:hypothetical protein n=1 Tax=Oricola sp. TaxID=1979950 RepID=UPI0025E3771D|nr:hypothetical protein [Oricola sp.]MCI5076677.1 hypothetical protein [Oricola sp.]
MTRLGLVASATCVAALLANAPARADYVIEEDPAFPSVIFIEFDPSSMPKIIVAPQAGQFNMPSIGGPGLSPDQNSPDLQNADKPDDDSASDDRQQEEEDAAKDDVSASADQRIEQRLEQLSVDTSQIEDVIIQNEIDTRILENADLLR